MNIYYYTYFIIYYIIYEFLKKFRNLQSQIEEYTLEECKRPLTKRWEEGNLKTDLDGL